MTSTVENLSAVVDDAPPAATPTLEGQLAQRRDRRRLDLMSLDGVAREGARVYRAFAAGRMGTKKYMAAVSGLRRQAETLRDIATKNLLDRQQAAEAAVVADQPAASTATLNDFYRTVRFVAADPSNHPALAQEEPPCSTN